MTFDLIPRYLVCTSSVNIIQILFYSVQRLRRWQTRSLLITHSAWWISYKISMAQFDRIFQIAFAHLLPNFVECWWDALVLDVLLCNGLGIWVGLRLCKMLEMREYKWVSIRSVQCFTSLTVVEFKGV